VRFKLEKGHKCDDENDKQQNAQRRASGDHR
jgi:hypothetical protein